MSAVGYTTNQYVGYDFGSTKKIYGFGFVNVAYDNVSFTQGVKNYKIEHASSSSDTFTEIMTGVAVRETSSSATMHQFKAFGSPVEDNAFRMYCVNNYGEGNCIGLSELQFYGRGDRMTLEQRVKILEDNFKAFITTRANDKFYTDADINGNRNSIANLTPWKATKTAYLYDTSIQFENVPEGNITVYFNPSVISANYTLERIGDLVRLTFDPLEEVTEVTLSIL